MTISMPRQPSRTGPLAVLKSMLPRGAKQRARKVIKAVRYEYRRRLIKAKVRRGDFMKIIVGAAETSQPGWFSTNEQWLDITNSADWSEVFQGKSLLARVAAEHVFEHLTPQESVTALKLIAQHLQNGGRVRIAVPDGYNPDPDYQRHVAVGGIGDDAADHKQVLNVDTLSEIFREAGFKPVHVEGYDRDGRLIQNRWEADDGFIWRSRQNNVPNNWSFVDANTSLIVDGFKA